ncbi:MAG TPA: extracellular solute-binding protein [Gaiellaceae bacterium]
MTEVVFHRHRRLMLPLLALVVALASLGGTASAARHTPAANTAGPPTAKQWKQLVAKAKQEGSVTIYSVEIPSLLADMAAKFKAKYGISVTVNRQIDNVLVTQVTAEIGTGKVTADLWVANSKGYVLGALKNGWVADNVTPHYYNKAYDRSVFAKPGKAWVVGSAVLGYGWNTRAYSTGLKSFKDLLNPALSGKIGVLQPLSPVAVDWYLWLEEAYGKDFITKLAALKPRIYPSSVPMQQALTSGEISAGSFLPTTTLGLIAQGAPVQFKLPQHPWNTPYYAMILKQAPHPAAAQLLADFLLSPEGQAAINHQTGAVLKNVPETSYVIPRIQRLSKLTPAKVTAFQTYWNSLFK